MPESGDLFGRNLVPLGVVAQAHRDLLRGLTACRQARSQDGFFHLMRRPQMGWKHPFLGYGGSRYSCASSHSTRAARLKNAHKGKPVPVGTLSIVGVCLVIDLYFVAL